MNSFDIPIFIQNKEIHKYLKSLMFFGIGCYDDLKDDEKEKLSHLIINSIGDDVFDVLDIDENDLPINSSSKLKIFSSIREKLGYYIDELIYELIEEKENNFKYENGLRSHVDNFNGELTWRRIFS